MEVLQHKQDADVENWDDGDFDDFNDIHFRSASTATSVVSHPQGNHRESVSSRMSMRSDSNQGDDHWDVMVDEQSSIKDALTIAKAKGIPLPSNVPRSALEGGTIRRLGGKAIKRAIADDWSEDLDFASTPGQLKLAKPEERDLSESLRQISAAFKSSPKSPEQTDAFELARSPKSRLAPTPVSLEKFQEGEDDDGFGDVPTIRVAKHRSPMKTIAPPSAPPPIAKNDMDDMDLDFELPSDGKLSLSTKNLAPRTPHQLDEFDAEWAEGSLGIRHAGVKRSAISNRSSSVASALSPSASSAFTAESEEDGLDGLVLPQGPVNFNEILRKRQDTEKENRAPTSSKKQCRDRPTSIQEDDFMDGLVLPQGEDFDKGRLSMHRNIKTKTTRSTSPAKPKAATTLNFKRSTNNTVVSRVPRYERQERPRSYLEPVSESGAPIQQYHRPTSRLGHTASSSVSSIPAPTTPTPSTPGRRDIRAPYTRQEARYQPATTTNTQLLRAKRSMPVMTGLSSPPRTSYGRPPSRTDGTSSRLRPRSPERSESNFGGDKRASAPFLPAGNSTSQSHHITQKSTGSIRQRRPESDGSGESMSAAQRSLSRLAGIRPETPSKSRTGYSVAELAAQAKKTMNKPLRRRNWGNGSELEAFDDLPTSATTEAKFTKQPIGRGAPKSLRSKFGQNQFTASNTSLASARSGNETPMPLTPLSPPKYDNFSAPTTSMVNVPRFARDTAASRNAREQRTISTTFHNIRGEPLQPISGNWKPQISTKPTGSVRSKKRDTQKKPHLIKPMGNDVNRPKEEKGMYYNPVLCRWEGNENALDPFEVPDFEPHLPSPPASESGPQFPPNTNSPAGKVNPALIMNVGGSSGVQLVNGMVFDPRQMRWLKVAPGETGDSLRSGTGSVQLEEEEDVFAGLEDLKEEESITTQSRHERERSVSGHENVFKDTPIEELAKDDPGNMSGSGEEWGVAEEFDVGPEFVRRQRGEEDRWRRKVEKWIRSEEEMALEASGGPSDWRWAIRDLVLCHDRGVQGASFA